MFRAVATCVTGSQIDHDLFRAFIVSRMGKNMEIGINELGTWGTDRELEVCSELLKTNIHVFHLGRQEWQLFQPSDEIDRNIYIIFTGNHFDVVLSC